MSHPSPKAKIHAVVTSVSPMKKSRTSSFFDGEISDGKACMRVSGFNAGVHRKLVEFEESKSAVALNSGLFYFAVFGLLASVLSASLCFPFRIVARRPPLMSPSSSMKHFSQHMWK